MHRYLGDIFAILTAVTWSVAVVFFKLSGAHLGTVQLKVFQNVIATGLFFLSIALLGEPALLDLSWADWLRVALSALIGITVGDTFYVAAINRIGAGFQAIVDGLYMPFVMILAYVFFHEAVPVGVLWGALLVIVAIALANMDVFKNNHIARHDLIWGIGYAVMSQLAMAVCVVMVKDLLQSHSLLTLTANRFLIGSVLLIGIYAWKGQGRAILEGFRPDRSWRVTLPGAILGPYAATLFWFAGFKYTLAGKAAVYNQLSTILIIILAALFLGERMSRNRVIAIVLALTGGWIVLNS